jgi:hypothetical protein
MRSRPVRKRRNELEGASQMIDLYGWPTPNLHR